MYQKSQSYDVRFLKCGARMTEFFVILGHFLSFYPLRHRSNCYFSFWAIIFPFNPLRAQKIKIFKKWKKRLEISSFYICVPKIMIRWCTVPEILCATDRRTDGQKKWYTEAGAPPKNCVIFFKASCMQYKCFLVNSFIFLISTSLCLERNYFTTTNNFAFCICCIMVIEHCFLFKMHICCMAAGIFKFFVYKN